MKSGMRIDFFLGGSGMEDRLHFRASVSIPFVWREKQRGAMMEKSYLDVV